MDSELGVHVVFSFTGAHGSGKTTLAKRLSNLCHVPLYGSRASEIFKRHGYRGGTPPAGFDARMLIQDEILEAWADDYATATRTGGVFDRTPLDFAAYVLTMVGANSTEREMERAHRYVTSCLEAIGDFDIVFFCAQIDGKMLNRGVDRPVSNTAYAFKIDTLIRGLGLLSHVPVVELSPNSVEHRVTEVQRAVEEIILGGEN